MCEIQTLWLPIEASRSDETVQVSLCVKHGFVHSFGEVEYGHRCYTEWRRPYDGWYAIEQSSKKKLTESDD